MQRSLNTIAALLQQNHVGIFPCDTIWGLIGCRNDEVEATLRQLKCRDKNHPFIVLVHTKAEALALCEPLTSFQEQVLDEYWPGPVTVVLPRLGGGTIGIRLPDSRRLVELIGLVGPLYSTSINISGERPVRDESEIPESIRSSIAFIARDDKPFGGEPSRIISVIDNEKTFLR